MKKLILALMLTLACDSQSQPVDDTNDDEATISDDGTDIGSTEEAITVQFASSGAATGRLMQGYKCTANSNGTGACDTGTSCAPSNSVCTPTRTNNSTLFICSTDATIRSGLATLASQADTQLSGSFAPYHVGVGNNTCTAGEQLKLFNGAVQQLFGPNDIRSYIVVQCNSSSAFGAATAPAGSSSATYNMRECNNASVNIDVAALLARGANGTEQVALLNRAKRAALAWWLGAGLHTATYNSTASRSDFTNAATTPALLSAGETCRFKGFSLSPQNAAVMSASSNCSND